MLDSQRRCAVRLPSFASKRELHRLWDLAAQQGLTVSEFIRQCLEDRYGLTFDGDMSHAATAMVGPIAYVVGER